MGSRGLGFRVLRGFGSETDTFGFGPLNKSSSLDQIRSADKGSVARPYGLGGTGDQASKP